MFHQADERKFSWRRTIRQNDESEDHWIHRIRVVGFYHFKNSVTGYRYWPDHWGTRPPANEAEYVEVPDLGPSTNGANNRRAPAYAD